MSSLDAEARRATNCSTILRYLWSGDGPAWLRHFHARLHNIHTEAWRTADYFSEHSTIDVLGSQRRLTRTRRFTARSVSIRAHCIVASYSRRGLWRACPTARYRPRQIRYFSLPHSRRGSPHVVFAPLASNQALQPTSSQLVPFLLYD